VESALGPVHRSLLFRLSVESGSFCRCDNMRITVTAQQTLDSDPVWGRTDWSFSTGIFTPDEIDFDRSVLPVPRLPPIQPPPGFGSLRPLER